MSLRHEPYSGYIYDGQSGWIAPEYSGGGLSSAGGGGIVGENDSTGGGHYDDGSVIVTNSNLDALLKNAGQKKTVAKKNNITPAVSSDLLSAITQAIQANPIVAGAAALLLVYLLLGKKK